MKRSNLLRRFNLLLHVLLLLTCKSLFAQNNETLFKKGNLTLNVDNKYVAGEENGTLFILLNRYTNFQISMDYMQGLNLEQAYQQYYLKGMPKEGLNFRHLEGKDRVILGRKYKWAKFRTAEKGIKSEHVIYMTHHDDNIYHFLLTNTSGRIDDFLSDIELMVQSMKFPLIQVQEKIIPDEILSKALEKKWTLYVEEVIGMEMPIMQSTAKYLVISPQGIKHFKYDGTIISESPFTYDEIKSRLDFKLEGRKSYMIIKTVTDQRLETREYDGFDVEVGRVYRNL